MWGTKKHFHYGNLVSKKSLGNKDDLFYISMGLHPRYMLIVKKYDLGTRIMSSS